MNPWNKGLMGHRCAIRGGKVGRGKGKVKLNYVPGWKWRFRGEREVARVTRGRTCECAARGRQRDKRGQKRAKQMSVNNRLRPAARRSTPSFASASVPVPLFH